MGQQKPQGFNLWKKLLRPERNFYIVTFTYACGISLLSLAIPISVQALVNTVTFAVLMQPLIVVSILLLILLVFSGFLRGLQDYAVEYFQRHFYVRTTTEVANQLMNAKDISLRQVYRGDLVNRYFDIMTVQKKMAKLLVDGISLVLQTIVGMLLLAFYHPYFLAFDIVLAALLAMVWILYGKQALDTAIYESKAKYKVGAWLEQLANLNKNFKSETGKRAAAKKTQKGIEFYLEKRQEHFKFLFRQIIFLLGIYAFLSTLILGLGGFLVMQGQLTLGQLVAAEIVVAVILAGFAKSGDYLEAVYDMHASMDKIADFYTIEQESPVGTKNLTGDNRDLIFKEVSVQKGDKLFSYNAHFHHGKAYLLTEDFDATQRVFLNLIFADKEADRGHIMFGEHDFSNICPYILRDEIYLIDKAGVMEGTVEENLSWGLEGVSRADMNEVLDVVGLTEHIEGLPEGKDTRLYPGTSLFCYGELIRLEVARVLLKCPSWVVISSLFQQVPFHFQEVLLKALKERDIGVIVWSAGAGPRPQSFDEEMSFTLTNMKKV